MSAIRLNPKLWERAKQMVMSDGKIWSARKAQQAVSIYKGMGGTYSDKIPRDKTSLKRWTDQNWQYISEKIPASGNRSGDVPREPGNSSEDSKRYLPKKVIDALTEKEKRESTLTKKKFNERFNNPPSVRRKFKKIIG